VTDVRTVFFTDSCFSKTLEGTYRIRVLDFAGGPWVTAEMDLPGGKKARSAIFWLNFNQVVTVEPASREEGEAPGETDE
jgi:hypothetical protein